jgi:uncharacterized protein YrrD
MLHSLEDVVGVCVIAKDGEIGNVRDFLLDDQTWKLRYFVVDVGTWLTRKAVLISVSARPARLGGQDLPRPLDQGTGAA